MQREYGMRRKAADGEIGLDDKLLFIERGRRTETLSVLRLPLSHWLLSDLLSAECIRNVTRDEGIVDGGSGGEMVAGRRGHKRQRKWV